MIAFLENGKALFIYYFFHILFSHTNRQLFFYKQYTLFYTYLKRSYNDLYFYKTACL